MSTLAQKPNAQDPTAGGASDTASLSQIPQASGKSITKDAPKHDILEKQVATLQIQIDSLRDTTGSKNGIQKLACVPTSRGDISNAEWLLIFLPVLAFSLAFVLMLYQTRDFSFKAALKENEVSKITVMNPYYSGQVTDAGETDVPLTVEVTPNVTIATANFKFDDSTSSVSGNQLPADQGRSEAGAVSQESQPNADDISEKSTSAVEHKDNLRTRDNMNYKLDAELYPTSISRYIALISSMLIIMISVSISCFFIYHYIKFGCPPKLGALSSVLLALGFGIVPYLANRISSSLKSGRSDV